MNSNDIVNKIIEEDQQQAPPEVVDLTQARETDEEHNSLNLAKRARGDGFAVNLDNLKKILNGDSKLKGAIQYNVFTYEIDVTRPMKLNGRTLSGAIDDLIIREIRAYIATKYKLDYKKPDIADILEVVAGEHSYNPLKDYLESCESEYKELVNQRDPFDILRHYLNIKDDEYNRIIMDLFFRGAVAKVFDPTIKFDFVLDLTGRQGVGKTQFFEGLFTHKYFTTVETFTDKDDKARMVRNWCVFDDEMVASKKASFSELKKFITETKLEFRPPYASSDRRLPKSFIIVRATNDHDYLNDLTGERRFLVAEVHKDTAYKGRKWTEKDRRAFWGAMVMAWRANQVLNLTDEQEKLVNEVRNCYKFVDETLEDLERYLGTPYPKRMYQFPPTDRTRYYYIYDMINHGYHMGANGVEITLDIEKYGELVERDKMAINLFFTEVYPDKIPNVKDKNKIKKIMQSKEDWEARESLRFGKSIKRGFAKIKK
ncbi:MULTISPECIES: virulence-associated E family protein [Streptococcus]|uniref:virulence-associated E family protein n=1 Tax=Streptococcus TaxID=1301 RepID=UPI00110C2CD3|nr:MULTISPECIES: virulence-associated E family protein [Streptococcus]MBF9665272.1 virulence-associated protein E [Streptococcus pseudopneumoniae]MBF9680625.1 virulence-associated protein E [Streptococcus pseudopneumoniae]NIB63559.1 virulence-associated protein E [Streptococcus pseudopneumoniae]TMR50032.1 virulence-associated protein E [Streptococcus pseudopneumoniae]TMR55880.1 virulence-associated protein E [Streptococcus pseudopneumoniae]